MPSVSTIAQAEEVRKTSPEQAIPLYQSILAAAAGTGMSSLNVSCESAPTIGVMPRPCSIGYYRTRN